MIQRLEISKMIYIDDFFLVIGYYSNDNNENEYLFLTKDGEIKDYFKLHSNTLAIKKINLKDTKLIVSLGYDLIPEEDGEYQEESKLPKTEIDVLGAGHKRRVIKVWNYSNLIMGEYESYLDFGLTGGYESGPGAPLMITLKDNSDSPPKDAIDVSICGGYIAVITSRNSIAIHKSFPNFNIGNDKGIKSRTINLTLTRTSSQILDLFFYKDKITRTMFIYIIASDKVYLLDTEKKDHFIKEISLNEMGIVPHCIDCDPETGNLLVSQTYHKDPKLPTIGEALYHLENGPTLKFFSDGHRVFTKLYGKLMVIVTEKAQKKKHYLEVYDPSTAILYYSCSYEKVYDILVDNNAIYLFVNHETNGPDERKELIKLTEITVGEKIKILLEKSLFKDAELVALDSEWTEEIKAAVAREHGDSLYENRKFKEAMNEYLKTIGYEAPSYVIEKYLNVQNLDLLIEYLERLIETPITKNNNLLGNNKDYTALLLNWYLKQQRKEKIEQQMTKDRGSDSIFDVETAIDVCRQKPGYTDLAIKLAERYEKWELLVSIYIENENPDIPEAIEIIDEKIKDVKNKVKLLQQYGSQLLNPRTDSKFIVEASTKLGKEKRALDLLIKITGFLIK